VAPANRRLLHLALPLSLGGVGEVLPLEPVEREKHIVEGDLASKLVLLRLVEVLNEVGGVIVIATDTNSLDLIKIAPSLLLSLLVALRRGVCYCGLIRSMLLHTCLHDSVIIHVIGVASITSITSKRR
jgi:hypothetical protein